VKPMGNLKGVLPGQLWLLALVVMLAGCASNSESYPTRDSKDIAAEETAKAVDTHVQLAVGYLQRGQLEIALEKIETALKFDSKSGDAHTVAGAINERIGRYDEADRHYYRAVKLEPKNGGVLNNYGQFLCKSGETDKAETYFQRAVEDPFYTTPGVAMGNACSCFVNAGMGQRAEPFCRDAIKHNANTPDPYFHLARVFYQQQEFMKARAFLQRYDAVGDNTPETLLLCVQIEHQLDAQDLALSCRDKLLNGFPKSEQARQLTKEASR
jgi:type IV pilus assembly protein PilF